MYCTGYPQGGSEWPPVHTSTTSSVRSRCRHQTFKARGGFLQVGFLPAPVRPGPSSSLPARGKPTSHGVNRSTFRCSRALCPTSQDPMPTVRIETRTAVSRAGSILGNLSTTFRTPSMTIMRSPRDAALPTFLFVLDFWDNRPCLRC